MADDLAEVIRLDDRRPLPLPPAPDPEMADLVADDLYDLSRLVLPDWSVQARMRGLLDDRLEEAVRLYLHACQDLLEARRALQEELL